METTMALRLPRDAASVPLIRQMLDGTLNSLGVEPEIRDDIELMLTEACSNVVKHAAPSDEYTVSAMVYDDLCVIRVVDTGHGFDPASVRDATPGSENGRGLQIMRALADDVRFTNKRENGAVVCLEKRLRYSPGAAGPHFIRT
ncbi:MULTISPECIES: ATP-binding protein [Nonomuraea]|uniref:ATP-binding protein n=2 Tax=Nonomuraea TaxID=83681 RepID=A0ABW1BPH6_9ACTN|nr:MULTISPECIES: ATP-binding protein [Nonomuraea]MDA0645636.1 ATP-binding protein [Nonomuraea ferruginea]TXK41210.1 ATP-binding protein [Nonomuraea sp. C10]